MKQDDLFGQILDAERELTKAEYKAVSKRANGGYIPANYYRRSIFNATVRESKELRRKKTVYEDEKMKIMVDRSLNQRHADALGLAFALGKITKPTKNGDVVIGVSLYQIAKAMGYKQPEKRVLEVKKMFRDMQHTLIDINAGGWEITHQMISDSYYSLFDSSFIVRIPAKTMKYALMTTGVAFDRRLTIELAGMPNKLAKLKAMIRFILSNRAPKHGYMFDTLAEKLGIESRHERSRFKRQLIENEELLEKFNIRFDPEEGRILYEQHEGVDFELPMKPTKIIEMIEEHERPAVVKECIGAEVGIKLKDGVERCRIVEVNRTDDGKWQPVAEDRHGNRYPLTPRTLEEMEERYRN